MPNGLRPATGQAETSYNARAPSRRGPRAPSAGIPTLAAVCEARQARQDLGLYGQVQLIIAGGVKSGADVAKAPALGADAVYIGTAALIALNCNRPLYVEDYHALGRSLTLEAAAITGIPLVGTRWVPGRSDPGHPPEPPPSDGRSGPGPGAAGGSAGPTFAVQAGHANRSLNTTYSSSATTRRGGESP